MEAKQSSLGDSSRPWTSAVWPRKNLSGRPARRTSRGTKHGERVVCEARDAYAMLWALDDAVERATLTRVDANALVLARGEQQLPVVREVERADRRPVLT
eukprot:scaffold208474_cov44-Tisochrysis_lutea.AAC.1